MTTQTIMYDHLYADSDKASDHTTINIEKITFGNTKSVTAQQWSMMQLAINQFATPLYYYDASIIRQQYNKLKSQLPNCLEVFYSLKANPSLAIAEIIKQAGGGCEVCSLTELEIALQSGFKPENIIYVGPGKTQAELLACLKHDIYAIVCESLEEINELLNLSNKKQQACGILIRINPTFSLENAALKMGGIPTQFGLDITELDEGIKRVQHSSHIILKGFHIYNGTRALCARSIANNMLAIINVVNNIVQQYHIKLQCIDLGGGFGIPYFTGEQELQVSELNAALTTAIDALKQQHPAIRIIVETGRYLVAEAGFLLTRILRTKFSHGEYFAICDAGMHCHLASTGAGTLFPRNFPLSIIKSGANRPESEQTRKNWIITGPLCTPGDVIARQISISSLQPNDFIVIHKVGAYGLSASPGRFLSHGFPAEILLEADHIYLIRQRETSQDILNHQYSLKHSPKSVVRSPTRGHCRGVTNFTSALVGEVTTVGSG